MKILISFLFMSCVFSASASHSDDVAFDQSHTQTQFQTYPGPGKGKKSGKRLNKKRKRKCSKWGRKSYAG